MSANDTLLTPVGIWLAIATTVYVTCCTARASQVFLSWLGKGIMMACPGGEQPASQQRPGWRLRVIERDSSCSTPRSRSLSTSSTLLPSG